MSPNTTPSAPTVSAAAPALTGPRKRARCAGGAPSTSATRMASPFRSAGSSFWDASGDTLTTAWRARPPAAPDRLPVDYVDDLIDAFYRRALDERRDVIDPLGLVGIGLGSPAAVVLLAHVEQSERDDLVLVPDVAGVVGALEARGLGVAWVPRLTKLVPGAGLQPAGGE